MTKTVAELQSELDRLDAEIRITREQEVGGPLDQITELMAQWSISLDQVARHFRHRFGMEASDTSLRRTDDPELTAFLTRAIRQILSDDPAPHLVRGALATTRGSFIAAAAATPFPHFAVTLATDPSRVFTARQFKI
ncbi:hypothetical protein [Burkholderia ambifaria]|nr:hypothetical protein [Burkholderia ambifaria]